MLTLYAEDVVTTSDHIPVTGLDPSVRGKDALRGKTICEYLRVNDAGLIVLGSANHPVG